MAVFLETIVTSNEGVQTAQIAKYQDELTATIFYHNALNINLRSVSDKTMKSFYANIHTESGVILRQERWSNPDEEPANTEPEPANP